jgi:hypothetical protein
MDSSYITSERFIHDGLIKRCEQLLKTAAVFWRPQTRLPTVLVAWPGIEIRDEDGNVKKQVTTSIKDPTAEEIQNFAKETFAWGLLVVTDTAMGVTATLTTPLGKHRWHLRARLEGGLYVLGAPITDPAFESPSRTPDTHHEVGSKDE